MDEDLHKRIKVLERLCRQTNKAVDDLAKRMEGLVDTMVSPQAVERRKIPSAVGQGGPGARAVGSHAASVTDTVASLARLERTS